MRAVDQLRGSRACCQVVTSIRFAAALACARSTYFFPFHRAHPRYMEGVAITVAHANATQVLVATAGCRLALLTVRGASLPPLLAPAVPSSCRKGAQGGNGCDS